MKLLSEIELENSCIVANNRMNRERVALGSNGYETDLQFDPIEFLIEKYQSQKEVAWLDLCCGRGKALIQTAKRFFELGLNVNTTFIGVDLVGMFDVVPNELDFISLVEASSHRWETKQQFDLITCVHGLHYVGDKLGLIKRAMLMLKSNGRFSANLDLENLRCLCDQKEIEFDFVEKIKTLTSQQSSSLKFNSKSNLISYANDQANQSLVKELGKFQFVGADDNAGPNYTGQEAVNSYYQLAKLD